MPDTAADASRPFVVIVQGTFADGANVKLLLQAGKVVLAGQL
ncbi:hypothetical protein [Ralstonia sp. SET104]|nr:hypothetical protein [Ralstonia sp. SET104]